MDLRLRIPYGFIRGRIRLTWREVLFGLKEELLELTAPIALAAEHITSEGVSEPSVVELAGLNATDDVRPRVEQLAAREHEQPIEEIQAKWLCVALAWTLERRGECADPLGAVEMIYADFEYPERIATLVRYMPSDEPDLGSRELNEARLYRKWKSYVQECSQRYSADAQSRGSQTEPS